MRDIVSINGTFRAANVSTYANAANTTGSAIDLRSYDGCMIYILFGTFTDSTTTVVIQETNANSDGTANSGGWANVATTDLVLWTATNSTSYTPVKVGNSQPIAITSTTGQYNQRVGYIGNKDYIRANTICTAGGTDWSAIDVIVNLGRPRLSPAAV